MEGEQLKSAQQIYWREEKTVFQFDAGEPLSFFH